MRFKQKIKIYPKDGDIKEKVKFLLFPKTISNEMRWLEFAKIKYIYYEDGDKDFKNSGWTAVEWLFYDPVKDCKLYKDLGCAHVDGPLCNDVCDLMKEHDSIEIMVRLL